jgi:hypothetical protein
VDRQVGCRNPRRFTHRHCRDLGQLANLHGPSHAIRAPIGGNSPYL